MTSAYVIVDSRCTVKKKRTEVVMATRAAILVIYKMEFVVVYVRMCVSEFVLFSSNQ